MDKRIVLPLACAAAMFAAPLIAAEHEVLVVDGGFFPDITYLNPGDIVTFTNLSGAAETVKAIDASWVISALADGASEQLIVTAETSAEFGLDTASEEATTARFSFDPAPVE